MMQFFVLNIFISIYKLKAIDGINDISVNPRTFICKGPCTNDVRVRKLFGFWTPLSCPHLGLIKAMNPRSLPYRCPNLVNPLLPPILTSCVHGPQTEKIPRTNFYGNVETWRVNGPEYTWLVLVTCFTQCLQMVVNNNKPENKW